MPKIIVAGAHRVGKTQIMNRLTNKDFDDVSCDTIGCTIYPYTVHWRLYWKDIDFQFQYWDVAGDRMYREIIPSYCHNAIGAVLVFDVTDRRSFDELNEWLSMMRSKCLPIAYIVLVGNKADLTTEREVTESEAMEFANQHNLRYFEVSAKDNTGVMEVLDNITQTIFEYAEEGRIIIRHNANSTRPGFLGKLEPFFRTALATISRWMFKIRRAYRTFSRRGFWQPL